MRFKIYFELDLLGFLKKTKCGNTKFARLMMFVSEKIIPYFKTNILRTSKKLDFEKFKKSLSYY